MRKGSKESFLNAANVKNYLRLKLEKKKKEVFLVLFLDNKHRLISAETMFSGTVDSCSVYPREVMKRALKVNASALIFAHNHPSGIAEPSMSDRIITKRLKDGLSLIDIRVLDHFIVGENEIVSFAERGLM